VKILTRRQTWIHTHFLTDGERLPPHRVREIETQVIPVLRQLGIVYDIHFEAHRDDPGVRIVLECIPRANTMEFIHIEVARILQTIPARPRDRQLVTFESSPASGDDQVAEQGLTTVRPEVEAEG
jgi:hypothetical protein